MRVPRSCAGGAPRSRPASCYERPRQQVHPALGAVVEAGAQRLDPLLDGPRAVVELLGELAQPPQVGLADELALPETLRHRLGQTLLAREPPYLFRHRGEARPA